MKHTPAANPASSAADWRPAAGNSLRDLGIGALLACLLASPILGIGGWIMLREEAERTAAKLAAAEAAMAYERLVGMHPGPVLGVEDAARGRDLFATSCIACHGSEGKGLDGLGLNLVESDFVARQTDTQLAQFIAVGRPAAKPVAMPPKGGRDDLTDDDLRHITVYLRGLQDPRRMPNLPAMAATGPSDTQKTAVLAAAGGDAELAGYIASGDKLFHTVCIACHGKAGAGIQGNGKALAANQFIGSLDDDSLLAFLKQGRAPTDPGNTTGIQMPPKGGNPALSDDDLLDIIAYVRTLQPKPAGATASK
jgi:mono/diheme cytochrome c family protein